MNENKQFIKARDYAYRLLSYRCRSAKEIKDRLAKKGFSRKIIKKTVAYLSQLNYINDQDFARSWVRIKIESHPVGSVLLRYQLRQKGIADEISQKVLSELKEQYNELEAAKAIAVLRRRRYKDLAPLKVKKRLYDYLRRRGFSQEEILEAIK